MKIKHFLSLFIATSLFISCAEDISDIAPKEDAISIEVNIPDDMKTRAFSDGSSINNLKCYVYAQGRGSTGEPIAVDNISLSDKKGFYHLLLPQGQNYDLVFLATSGEQENPSGKTYYNRTDRTFNVNYGNFTANDESVDCFMGVIPSLSTSQSSYSITLKRPFAQLNVGAKDLDDYNSMSISTLNTVNVSVDGVYSSMNVMNGNVTGGKSKVSFPQSTPVAGNSFPVSGVSYLSMCYLLVNQRENTTVNVQATTSNGSSFDFSYDNIPLQRNYRTNIYGNLLTNSKDYKVEISPDFSGQENKEVYADYDLVMRVVDNYADWDEFGISIIGRKVIDLLPYVDSNKLIKIRWSDLDMDDVHSFTFHHLKDNSVSLTNPVLDILKFDISGIPLTDLSNMFFRFGYIKNLDAIKNWDTSKITDMSSMFWECTSLSSLDLSGWNTSNVTDMAYMFYRCEALSSLDVSHFDTSNVTDMGSMFSSCKALSSIDVSHFDTSKVTNMRSMFSSCKALSSIDVSHFDTSNVTDMGSMFSSCEALTSLDLSHFDTSNVTDMGSMFSSCKALTSLDLSHFDTSNVTDMGSMFSSCKALTSLDLSHFDTSNVTDMGYMFSSCKALTSLDLSHFDTSNVTDMGYMFSSCEAISSLDLSGWNTSNVTNMGSMFSQCDALTSLDLSHFDTSNVTKMNNMFLTYPHELSYIKCKQSFKDWCITNADKISLGDIMKNGTGTWDIVP